MNHFKRNSSWRTPAGRFAPAGLWVVVVALWSPIGSLADEPPKEASEREFTTRAIQGRVVWLAEAMERLHGVQAVTDAAERVLALETPEGQLYPLVEDVRGGAFRADKRLRGIEVELLVRQYDGVPFVQVIQVFTIKEDGKYELDYWCDICAISMFELKVCDCCQGPIELREVKAE